jgi:hypothetical protein
MLNDKIGSAPQDGNAGPKFKHPRKASSTFAGAFSMISSAPTMRLN